MTENLPPEIVSVYSLLSEEEKKFIDGNKEISTSSKLDEMEKVLLVYYAKSSDLSIAFTFLIGRILYHRGKLEKIIELYTKNPDEGIGLWYLICRIYEGKFEEYKEGLETIKPKIEKTIFYAFLFYIQAIEAYLIQDFKAYEEQREYCFNFYGFAHVDNLQQSRELFKLIQIYMLEMDSIYLQSTYILSIARDKTKESLNINKALNDRICYAQIYNSIGNIELERGNFQLAHQIFLKAEAIAKEIKIDRLLGHITEGIGNVYRQLGHLDEAIYWYDKSKKIIKNWSTDYRSLFMLYSSYAEAYFSKEEFSKAKVEMEKVLDLIQSRGFQNLGMRMKYVEILLYLDEVKECEDILSDIEKNKKGELTSTQKSNFWFLLGFLEYKKNNYGNSQDFLQKAMLMADELGNEILSSKTLVLLSIVFLKKYTITMNLEELMQADKCLEDIITYLEEKAKYESLSLIYHVRAKIKIVLLDFETALFLLKTGEEFARTYTPQIMTEYQQRIEQVKSAIDNELDKMMDEGVIDFIDDIQTISTILRKESKKLAAPKEEKPIAVLIFHSSGIPIRTYLSEDVSVSDDLLFGGFVSAIRHLMNELFIDQSQGVLSIDHGQYKLLIEFYSNVFSVVVIALRDSFMIRRKMHRLVENLSFKGLSSDKYKGDMGESESYELDSVVRNLFGIKGHRP